MASIAQSLPASNRPLAWVWEWLRQELAPYPGRTHLVARMVTAATLVMLISMTYRLSYGADAALFALNVSRDSLEGSRRAVRGIDGLTTSLACQIATEFGGRVEHS